jgi:hypothetical protein
MIQLRLRSPFALLAAATSLALACSPSPLPQPDASADAGADGSSIPDGATPDGNVSMPDGSTPDGSTPDGGMMSTGPRITTCAGDALPSLASGTCQVTAGSSALLITGDVLTPGEVFRGGQVAVNAMGQITCVGCDCAAMATGATQIVCPDGVVSPGLIDAHEHLTFNNQQPYTRTDERYEHRHDWRVGNDGHTRIRNNGGSATAVQMAWIELRHVLGGATSVNGSGGTPGYLRNLDANSPTSTTQSEGAMGPMVDYETFPYGDTSGTELRGMNCGTPPLATLLTRGYSAYTPHIAEGIEQSARNEFLCARSGMNDIVGPQAAFIHGVALLAPDIAELARDGTDLIWSPRSNITLYGDTARVTEYARLGVNIALGTDWLPTGSMNMLRELRCADTFNRTFLNQFFSDEQLWLMTTRNAAQALGWDNRIGTLAVGRLADISIFDARTQRDHRAVIEAEPRNVALVLRGGVALYGDDAIVSALPNGAMCETLDVCATMKRVCVRNQGTAGMTLSALQMANSTQYPLFFCGEPMNEPSCLPARTRTMAPAASVSGSTVFTGMSTMDDRDGDGIANAMDNCADVFNPIRPIDNMRQADTDMDMLGDACDPCPLNANTTMCTAPDPNDRDGDMVPNDRDNCPDNANPSQADADMDGKGDVCDPCPMAANPGAMMCPGMMLTIPQIRNPMSAVRPASNAAVAISGAVVTAVKTAGTNFGFFVQDRAATEWGGIYIFTGTTRPAVNVGDLVNASGSFTVFNGLEQIDVRTGSVMAMGTAAVPMPVVVTPAEIRTGGTRAMQLQSMLLRVNSVTCTAATPATVGGMSIATDFLVGTSAMDMNSLLITSFVVSDTMAPPMVSAMLGDNFTSIVGVGYAFGGQNKLAPRTLMDVTRM